MIPLWIRLRNRIRRDQCRLLARKPFPLAISRPIISFTFDDFPVSAWENGGRILEQHALLGTYYVALKLMGGEVEAGKVFNERDLAELAARGHELGCHTYQHCPSWETPPLEFERAILKNRACLAELLPGVPFKTLSWPINSPRPKTKRLAAKYFSACRGGGQGFNSGLLDLNFLNSFFIEQERERPELMRDLIAQNSREQGWLIFSTHDVCAQPSRLGCTESLFEQVVRYSIESGAEILPVGCALEKIGALKSAREKQSRHDF